MPVVGQQLQNYGLIDSIEELATFTARLIEENRPVGFDIETGYVGPDREKFSLHPETAIVVGISFTNDRHWARYVPLAHDDGPNVDNLEAARLLWPVLSSGRGVAHNAAFEQRHLSRWFLRLLADDPIYGEQVRACRGRLQIRSCTMVEAYLMAEYEEFGLKPLVRKMFHHEMTELIDLFPDLPLNRKKMLRFNVLDCTDPKVFNYACEDSAWALAIHEWYRPQVEGKLLYAVEMAIATEVCPDMEEEGVLYDWQLMRDTAEELRIFRDRYNGEIMRELSDELGEQTAINLASPPQVSKLLFGQLGLTTTVYTNTTRNLPPAERRMSTGKVAMEGLAKQHPTVAKIREWKQMTRLLGTYLDRYEGLYAYADDGRTHPSHLSAFVVTGRFAVADPPYQQSPKDYHYDLAEALPFHERHVAAHGKKCSCRAPEFEPPLGTCFRFNFRDAIMAPPDHYIIGYDLSQAELRAIAGEAQEESLLTAFREDRDVHSLTAALMLNKKLEDVTKDDRDLGKTQNFALGYGMSVKGLADRLGISIEHAQALFDKYFAALPSIAAWREHQVATGKRQGFVTSKFGRKLPIWQYRSEKRWIYNQGDRACINYPIQGGATGDFVKIGMIRAHRAIRNAGLADKVKLVMNVHDALEFYVHRSVPPQKVIELLEPAVVFPVDGWPPMKAEWHVAKRWGSPQEVQLRDGRLIVLGAKEYEVMPEVDVDEDTGEEIVVFPQLNPEALKQVIEARPEEGRRVLLTLERMPEAEAWERFLGVLADRPGSNTLVVCTPEGDVDVDLPAGHNLTPRDIGIVSVYLGTVTMRYDEDDIEAADLLQGLTF